MRQPNVCCPLVGHPAVIDLACITVLAPGEEGGDRGGSISTHHPESFQMSYAHKGRESSQLEGDCFAVEFYPPGYKDTECFNHRSATSFDYMHMTPFVPRPTPFVSNIFRPTPAAHKHKSKNLVVAVKNLFSTKFVRSEATGHTHTFPG